MLDTEVVFKFDRLLAAFAFLLSVLFLANAVQLANYFISNSVLLGERALCNSNQATLKTGLLAVMIPSGCAYRRVLIRKILLAGRRL